MRKYLTLFRVNWQNSLQYRASTVIYIVGYGLYISVLLYLWHSVYQSGKQMGAYSVSDMMTYYLLQMIMNTVILSYISWDLIDQIREGFFSNFLIKPVNTLAYWFTINLSGKLLEIIYIGTTLLVLYLTFGKYFVLPPDWKTGGIFLICLFLALCLSFLLDFCIAMIAFWLIQVRVFKFMLQYIIFFFAGAILPLDLFPEWLRGIIYALPFQYIIFVPIQIYLGKISVSWDFFLRELAWIFFFLVLARLMLARGIRRYEAVGG
ncbi:MAG TPA: ABC-2 family transporter protein [Nitrospiria bacterium]|nr:ABC-2 family transporter protein [Nitrospiria bacterium]